MNTAIPSRYLLAANFQQCAIDFSFPAEVWSVAAALSEVSQATSPFELEQMTGLGYDRVREALERLLAKKLIREDVMSWKEFNAVRDKLGSAAMRAPAGAVRVAPGRVSPPSGQEQTIAPPDFSPRNGHLSGQESVAMRLGSITPQTSAVSSSAWVRQDLNATQTAALRPGITAAIPSGDPSGGRLLRPILEQIERIKGGGVEGQLLVYQVFLRVPYDLLCEEGIKSLHFVDDQTTIHNPKLLEAIVKAAKDVTGVELA